MPHLPERVDDAVLADLRDRLSRTRLTTPRPGLGWELGTDLAYLAELVQTWTDDYDWRTHEDRILGYDWHVTSNGTRLIHRRATEDDSVAVVLLHGWPDSFLRFERVLPLLRDVHVLVPCLPGYPYGREVLGPGISASEMTDEIAHAIDELGYDTYVVSGGDIGCWVAESLAATHPDRVASLHLTDMPLPRIFAADPTHLDTEERAYFTRARNWFREQGAYANEQRTKPQSLAVGIGDSPAGLAAWIIEKLYAWSDSHGDIETHWNRDELLTWLTLYWVTGAIGTSFGPYVGPDDASAADLKGGRIEVPTAVTIFPKDIAPAPRAFGERLFSIASWDVQPAGGHFGAWEEPEAFVEGLRKAIDLAQP